MMRRLPLLVAIAVCLVIIHLWRSPQQTSFIPRISFWRPRTCHSLPGTSDLLVVLRTGATEVEAKLPVHLQTTLSCFPNHVIFSDLEEDFASQHVFDTLMTVSEAIRLHHRDFELYRKLHQHGRTVLEGGELAGPESDFTPGVGKDDKPGWKLDKWKFLPMFNETQFMFPDFKWYFFMEPDTGVFMSTILQFVGQLDPSYPYYMGAQINIGEVEFAHGGSGVLVSKTALDRVVQHYAEHQSEWETFTDGHWAGDCVAGKAFNDAGAGITRTWPIIQGDHPGVFPWGRNDNFGSPVWCSPTSTYHHLPTDIVQDMWQFEQQWLDKKHTAGEYLRYRDVFIGYIMPKMKKSQSRWDNKCDKIQGGVENLKDCVQRCQDDAFCLQYQFDADSGVCKTSSEPRLGEVSPSKQSLQSGWMYDRIERWRDARPECSEDHWITGN